MYLVTCIYSKLYLILNGHWHLFCKTRWLENSDITARLIELIEPVRKWIHHLITIKKEPKAQSYHKIKTILADDLMIVKLKVIKYVSVLFEPLVLFQSFGRGCIKLMH